MPRRGIGFARQQFAARGDALPGNRRRVRSRWWQSRRNQNTRGQTCQAAEPFVREANLNLRLSERLFGAGGENRIGGGLRGRRRDDGEKGKKSRRIFHRLCAGAALFGSMMRLIRSCHRGGVNYTPQVRLKWRFPWLAIPATLALVGAGCGGINTSQSVSPASFFLPGIMKVGFSGGDQRPRGGVRHVQSTRPSPIILCDSPLR